MDDRKNVLPRNEELSFLYKKSSLKPSIISKMSLVPEFIEALSQYEYELTDIVIYEVLKKTMNKMIDNGKSYRTAVDVMNKVSKSITGDTSTWRNDS